MCFRQVPIAKEVNMMGNDGGKLCFPPLSRWLFFVKEAVTMEGETVAWPTSGLLYLPPVAYLGATRLLAIMLKALLDNNCSFNLMSCFPKMVRT